MKIPFLNPYGIVFAGLLILSKVLAAIVNRTNSLSRQLTRKPGEKMIFYQRLKH